MGSTTNPISREIEKVNSYFVQSKTKNYFTAMEIIEKTNEHTVFEFSFIESFGELIQ